MSSLSSSPESGTSFLYFAYGSNLLAQRLLLQNPSAVSKGPARLDHYQLQFRLPSKRWGGCAATVTPTSGAEVWGVLWELDQQHLATLDEQEGVSRHIYERFAVRVSRPDREDLVEAYTYRVLSPKLRALEDDCRPSGVYKSIMVKGAVEQGLPEDYVQKLKSLPDTGYDDEVKVKLDLSMPSDNN